MGDIADDLIDKNSNPESNRSNYISKRIVRLHPSDYGEHESYGWYLAKAINIIADNIERKAIKSSLFTAKYFNEARQLHGENWVQAVQYVIDMLIERHV